MSHPLSSEAQASLENVPNTLRDHFGNEYNAPYAFANAYKADGRTEWFQIFKDILDRASEGRRLITPFFERNPNFDSKTEGNRRRIEEMDRIAELLNTRYRVYLEGEKADDDINT